MLSVHWDRRRNLWVTEDAYVIKINSKDLLGWRFLCSKIQGKTKNEPVCNMVKRTFFVSGAAATEEVICPLSSPIDLLLPKGSFIFVTKLRAPAQNQQALQSSFLYHNLQIITSVRKSCSGDYRSCLQTQCHHKLMPTSRQWGLCRPDLAGFQPIQRQGQDTSTKCRAWLFFFFIEMHIHAWRSGWNAL